MPHQGGREGCVEVVELLSLGFLPTLSLAIHNVTSWVPLGLVYPNYLGVQPFLFFPRHQTLI